MDEGALQAVRGELPGWIGLAPILIWVPAAWLLARWTSGLGLHVVSGPLRRLPAGCHWSERARQAMPVRVTLGLCAWITLAVLSVLAWWAGGSLSYVPPMGMSVVIGFTALAGAISVHPRFARDVGRARGALEIARDDGVLLLLSIPHLALALVLAWSVRAPFELWDVAVVAFLALFFAAIAAGGALELLAWLRLTQPPSPKLRSAVEHAARALGVPVPQIVVLRWDVVNAFAFPLGGRLAFSARCAEGLSDEALVAVSAHELGHLSEPLAVRLLRGAMLFAFLPLVGIVACVDRWGVTGVLPPLGGMVVVLLLFRIVAARMERRADELAHAACPPETYARALERIYALNSVPAVMPGKGVHPHLYDRMLSAGVTPDFPRPAPPPKARGRVALAVALLFFVPAATLLAGLPILMTPFAAHDVRASDLRIALERGSEPLMQRALVEYSHGNTEPAVRFANAALALDPWRHDPHALVAMSLAQTGRCNDARRALLEAEALALDGADDAWVVSAQASLDACVATAAAR
jgi:Zn-dependent protease with chaperone function